MDSPSHLVAAVVGAAIATALSETDPLVRAIGGGASVGSAVMCAWEMRRDQPQWDRAAGQGAAFGAAIGSLVLAYDMLSRW